MIRQAAVIGLKQKVARKIECIVAMLDRGQQEISKLSKFWKN